MKKKHTTRGKYACEICERAFRKSKTLRLHIRQDHENQSCRSGEKDVQDENKDGEHKDGVDQNKENANDNEDHSATDDNKDSDQNLNQYLEISMETDIGSDIPISEEGHHRKSKRLKTTVEKFDGKISLGRADQEFSLSPEELPYRTRFVAIQDMFKRNYSNKDIEAMKELIIKHEGWVRSDLLPEGWMFKQIAEGITMLSPNIR